mgnify:CR=1 FL=1
MDRFLCKQGAVNLYRRKSVKCFHNCLIGYFHRFLDRLPITISVAMLLVATVSAAAEGFELAVTDDVALVIDIEIDSHDIAAFCVSDSTYAAGVLNFSHVSWVLEMVHYFL